MLKHANGKAVSIARAPTPQEQRRTEWKRAIAALKYGDTARAQQAFGAAEIANLHAVGAPRLLEARG